MKVISTPQQTRYFWQQRLGGETCYSLIDRVTAREIATVTYVSTMRKWRWSRRTTPLLHGAEPAEGIAKLLVDAKQSVETGLPLDA